MNTLLLLSLGPVQEFIERSRRMRDLWLGSHLLSEMARAAAQSLAEQDGWSLVFPALEKHHPDLQPCDGMWTKTGDRPLAVVNKILATRIDTDDDTVLAHVERARQAAIQAWRRFADRAVVNAGSLLRKDLPSLHRPENVVEDLLELVAAWVRYEDVRDYGRAREEAERRLASRKLLRDFRGWPGLALPKSSLDGFRETVLVANRSESEAVQAAQRFRLGDQEQLDGIGLVKRMGGNPEQFVPIATIALAPWIAALVRRQEALAASGIDGARDTLSRSWAELVEECRRLQVPRCDLRSASWMPQGFPYDGEIFLEGQWGNLSFRGRSKGDDEAGRAFGKDYVKPVLDSLSRRRALPYPYVACLVADGDRMGEALCRLGRREQHEEFARRITAFARGARSIVERKDHLGVLIYSGGDDVLAFVPVHAAPSCAQALYESFHDHLTGCFEDGGEIPTLSIGIGVGHVLSPMGELLALGREAERLAKHGESLLESDSRNALAVIVEKRGGARNQWRARWPEAPVDMLSKIEQLFLRRQIPGKLPYELDELLRVRFPDVEHPEARNSRFWADCLAQHIRVILRKKRPDTAEGPGLSLSDIDLELDPAEQYDGVAERVRNWIDRARISKAIADSRDAVENIPPAEERVDS